MNNIEIKTFGKITEIVNENIVIHFPTDLKSLKSELEKQFPDLSKINYTIAVNNEIINEEDFIVDDLKILAIMPPFSGG
jgi:molybdopterin converting factor small subunit